MIEGYPVKPLSGGLPLNGLYHQLASSSEWACEAKLDGVRAFWDGTELWSRTGNRLPRVDDLKALLPSGVPLDGELVHGVTGPVYWLFDLPGVAEKPYTERRNGLESLELCMAFNPDCGRLRRIRLMPYVTWEDVERLDLEGVVFKRVTSLYTMAHRPGTTDADWIKFRKEDKA